MCWECHSGTSAHAHTHTPARTYIPLHSLPSTQQRPPLPSAHACCALPIVPRPLLFIASLGAGAVPLGSSAIASLSYSSARLVYTSDARNALPLHAWCSLLPTSSTVWLQHQQTILHTSAMSLVLAVTNCNELTFSNRNPLPTSAAVEQFHSLSWSSS